MTVALARRLNRRDQFDPRYAGHGLIGNHDSDVRPNSWDFKRLFAECGHQNGVAQVLQQADIIHRQEGFIIEHQNDLGHLAI
jgi:hypothetical protein